ncbi:MAG: DUF2231 domain-containing protein [Pseudomonadota bacterium]
MSKWECGVCGYIQKEGGPPEQCPVCEAPKKMFNEIIEAKPESSNAAAVTTTGKRWKCLVCGYVHVGKEAPESCPVCAAPKSQFVEIDAEGKRIDEGSGVLAVSTSAEGNKKNVKVKKSFFSRIADLILKLHLHPISVHFPNGILPAVVGFLAISMYFHIVSLEQAAYYNLIFVLLMMPVVLLTGFVEWQKRYKGAKSFIFITKILCSLVVLAATNVLVFWRVIDPAVLAQDSPTRLIYLGVAAAMLAAVGIAGHLGGKLVFGTRG